MQNQTTHPEQASQSAANLAVGASVDFDAQPAPALSRQFKLGAWSVLPDLNRLQHRRTGEERQLEPRLMHLLCYLSANPNQVVSREALVSELWPKVIVNENSLTRAMSELRKHLADSKHCKTVYVETIPKKGYRLLPTVELCQPSPTTSSTSPSWASWMSSLHQPFTRTAAAMSFSLAMGVWIGLGPLGVFSATAPESGMLADEVIAQTNGFYGGEVTLSTATDTATVVSGIKSVEAPVVSNDQSQYAYIQHDNAGSTIFLGRLDALASPVVAVYNTPEKLFNLTWSPLGHRLIFALQPNITSAAIFPDDRSTAELLSLDLTTMEVHRLVPDTSPAQAESGKPHNLT